MRCDAMRCDAMRCRWLRAPADRDVDDYAYFWFRGGGWRRQYTFWPAHALWERALLAVRA